MKPITFKRNAIQLPSTEVVIKQLLVWLADHAQKLGLLLFCVESTYQTGEKGDKVFGRLKKEAMNTLIDYCEEGDRIADQKNLGSLVFYMHHGIARGISITFGCYETQNPDLIAEQKKDIYEFIATLPTSTYWRSDIFRQSLLRMCLAIYAAKDYDYTVLGFNHNALVYRWPDSSDVFQVNLFQAYGIENEIHLQVVKPKKNSKKRSNWYKRYYSHLEWIEEEKSSKEKRPKDDLKIQKEVTQQLKTRMPNEILWNALFESLLIEAAIPFSRRQFTPNLKVLIDKEQHEMLTLSMKPMGADLSHLPKKHLRKQGFTFSYAFMKTDQEDELNIDKTRAALNSAVEKLNAKSKSTTLRLIEVPFQSRLTAIDIIIDMNEPEEDAEEGADTDMDTDREIFFWKSSTKNLSLDYYGQYRKKRINAGKITTKQLISRHLLLGAQADTILYRSITDLLLKKWLASSTTLRQVQVPITASTNQTFIVMGTRKWAQKNSGQRPTPYNIFTAFYKMTLFNNEKQANTMQIHEPQIHSVWGAPGSPKNKPDLLSYLSQAANKKSHASTLFQLLSTVALSSDLMAHLNNKFLNHGSTYLFEIKNQRLAAIWELLPEHQSSLIPELSYDIKNDGKDYRAFLFQCLKKGLFSRDDSLSQISENKRLSGEAVYDIEYSANTVVIARKTYAEKQNTNRTLLQQVNRLYHSDHSTEIKESDLQPILAGLLSDIATGNHPIFNSGWQ